MSFLQVHFGVLVAANKVVHLYEKGFLKYYLMRNEKKSAKQKNQKKKEKNYQKLKKSKERKAKGKEYTVCAVCMLAAASSGHPDSMMIRAERLRLCTVLVLLVLSHLAAESRSRSHQNLSFRHDVERGRRHRPCFTLKRLPLSTYGEVHRRALDQSRDLRSDPCIDGWSGVTCDEEDTL